MLSPSIFKLPLQHKNFSGHNDSLLKCFSLEDENCSSWNISVLLTKNGSDTVSGDSN